MEKEKSCGAIVYNDKAEVLIVKHNKGHWDFPKGHMEVGESEIQTARREVKEETNVDIDIIEKIRYEVHYNPKKDVEKTVVFFLAYNTSNELIKQDKEISNIGWYSYEKALEILTYDSAKQLFKKSYEDLINVKENKED